MRLSAAPTVLKLHQHFSSNMVLQRGPKQATVWGEAVPGSSITVAVGGEKAGSATADWEGNWQAALTAQPLRLNTSLTVTDGVTTLNLTNVAFGDVYLCSGQSNMVHTHTHSQACSQHFDHTPTRRRSPPHVLSSVIRC